MSLGRSLRVRQLHLDEGLFGGKALCGLGLQLDRPGFLSRERNCMYTLQSLALCLRLSQLRGSSVHTSMRACVFAGSVPPPLCEIWMYESSLGSTGMKPLSSEFKSSVHIYS